MSNGQWLPLEQIGLLPALSPRRSVLLAASEKSLCFYRKAEMGVERREWEKGGGGGERKRETERERESNEGQSLSWLQVAGFPPSRPAVTHSPHTAFSLTNSYTPSPSHTHIYIYTHTHTHTHILLSLGFILFLPHIPMHTNTFHSFLLLFTCAHTPVVLVLHSALQ